MAYTERYYHDYCNPREEPCRLSLLEWEYTGDPEEVEAAVYPFMKSLDNSAGLKVGGVYPTVGTATFVATDTFDMELLYTADETKYRILHTVNGVQDWIGNVIPNGFYEDRHGENRHMVITASDRLPVLQGKLFTDTDGTNYGVSDGVFRRSFLWAIKEALKKTELLLPIWTLVDVKALDSSEGITRELSTGFVSGFNTIRLYDTTGTVDAFLQPGVTVSVTGGVNDGRVFTVISWVTTPQWNGSDYISITVSENVVDSGGFSNVRLQFSVPVDPSTLPDPLAAASHDVRVWINEADEVGGQNYFQQRQTAKTAWEVLDAIARQWNARICLNGDHWEVLRWNVFKVPDGEYEWFRYNSEGTFLGRTPFGGTVEIPCHNTSELYELYGSQKAMDRVLKGVNVNYRFKYKVDGDSLANLIKNGNFAPPFGILIPPPTSDPFTYTPEHWTRVVYNPFPLALTFHALPAPPGSDYPPGNVPYIEMQGMYHGYNWLTSDTGYDIPVAVSESLRIYIWYNAEYLSDTVGNTVNSAKPLVVRIFISPPNNGTHRQHLANNGPSGLGNLAATTPEQRSNAVTIAGQWVPYTEYMDDFMSFEIGGEFYLGPPAAETGWRQYLIEAPPSPVAGKLYVEIVGVGEPKAPTTPFRYSLFDPGGTYRKNGRSFSSGSTARFASLFVGKVVDPSGEAVPQIHGYTYPSPADQRTRNYTDTIPDIEVLTGDDGDPDHVGNIYIGNGYASKWDTWAMEHGWSALGLLLAKSVMEQYWTPWRMVTGTFSAHGLTWTTKFTLEDRPGEVYVILRGALNAEDDTFTGTLVQVWDEGTDPLPPGGSDGGNTTDPQWSQTDTTRCVRDSNAENTGHVEILETDTNPASPTYGQERWIDIGEDTDACPIGEPIDLYWGEQVTLDAGQLRYFPYVKEGDAYTVTYNGDDSDKVLRLLHRSSLGTVRSILYAGNYESISGWQYDTDVTVNGYTYKHLYLTWPVGVFTDLPVIFVIN